MTFWQKKSEKCELLGLSAVWVSSLVGIVLLPVLLERGMFIEQFWCKTEILFKHIFMQNGNQSTICNLINLLSWITVKRVYMAYLGQKKYF